METQIQQNEIKTENVDQTDSAAPIKDVQKDKNKTKGRCSQFSWMTESCVFVILRFP